MNTTDLYPVYVGATAKGLRFTPLPVKVPYTFIVNISENASNLFSRRR